MEGSLSQEDEFTYFPLFALYLLIKIIIWEITSYINVINFNVLVNYSFFTLKAM